MSGQAPSVERATIQSTGPTRGLARRTVVALGFSLATSTSGRVFTIAATFALARLLTPNDFGIANIGALVLTILLPVTDIGIARALVRARKEELSQQARTAFWLVVLLGVAMAAVLFLASGWVASFYGRQEIEPTLRVIGVSVVLYSISRIPSALLERELLQGRKAIPEMAAALTYGITAIALAYLHFGYWSVVAAMVARSAVLSGGLFLVAKWRPGLAFDMEVAHELISSARLLMATSVIRLIYTNVDNAVVGKILGITALGYYAMAYNLGNLAAVQVAGALGAVLFPMYARLLPDLAGVRQMTLRILRYTSIVVIPITLLGIIATPRLVPLALGPRWAPLTLALQILLVYGCFHSLGPIYWALLMAKDLNQINLRINLVSLVVALLAALPVAATYGFNGVAAEFTLLEIWRFLSLVWAARQQFALGVRLQAWALGPAITGSCLACIALLTMGMVWRPAHILVLGSQLLVASALYLSYLVATGPLAWGEMAGMVRTLKRRPSASASAA